MSFLFKQQQKLQINFTSLTVIRLKVLGTDIWNPNFNVSLGKSYDLFWTSLSLCEQDNSEKYLIDQIS